jgi:hypothetical protein
LGAIVDGRFATFFEVDLPIPKRSAVWILRQAEFCFATFLASSGSLLRPKKAKKVRHGRKKGAILPRMGW